MGHLGQCPVGNEISVCTPAQRTSVADNIAQQNCSSLWAFAITQQRPPSPAFAAVGTIVGTMSVFKAAKKKDLRHSCAKSLIYMVGVIGFEPTTPCTPCKYFTIR